MTRLLVIHHSPTASLRALTDAVVAGRARRRDRGGRGGGARGARLRPRRGRPRGPARADGYLLGTTANFGYMSGAMKHVFDSTFLQIGGALSDDGSGEESAGATRAPVRALRARSLRHDRRRALGALDHRRAGLDAGVRRARGDGRARPRRTSSRRTSSAVPSRHCSPEESVQRRTHLTDGRLEPCFAVLLDAEVPVSWPWSSTPASHRLLGAAEARRRSPRRHAPKLANCYALTPEDTAKPSTDAEPVDCSAPHTAQTFAVGTLPATTGKDYKSPAHGKWIFPTCQTRVREVPRRGHEPGPAGPAQLGVVPTLRARRGRRARAGTGATWSEARRTREVRRAADRPQGPVPGQAARAVAHLRAGTTVSNSKKVAVRRAAQLARGHHDQAR